jgi:hypothetical protein
MCGDDPEKKRTETTARFRTEDNLVLISTDAAAEGLNLHQRCHHLIHLELPFNPNRLEQRNGRIDRYGQNYEPQVRYLYLRGTFEERILMRLIAKWERQRAKLKFMPNTLGLTIAPGSGPDRLLKGIMDEDTKLFQDEGPAFNPMSENENDGADPATLELLEEVDRSLKSFEKAAKSHSWLAETGLNADERQMNEAAQARERGTKGSCVDLAQFVADAVRLDGGELKGLLANNYFTLSLPPAWCANMDDLPGYELSSRQMRLTTKMETSEDEQKRSVGFLGRAHPLVRRALDRVRNLSYGANVQQSLDPRASAVKADVPEPTILYTYLGRVSSGAGRELECVIAVRVTASGKPQVYLSHEEWSNLADSKNAIRTQDVWKKHFAKKFEKLEGNARQQAEEAFQKVADTFYRQRQAELEFEQLRQRDWLKQRASEIAVAEKAPLETPTLFEGKAAPAPGPLQREWGSKTDPQERLAGFALDRVQPPSRRSEAEGVLQLYKKRMAELTARLALEKPTILPLGLLMLVPEKLVAKGGQ